MKGLLIKDIRLMKGQSTILLALLILVAVFTGVVSDVSPSFVVAYITIFLSIFVASTISYDEFDHGYLFLMTLPITRNKYVNEKYIFGILISIFAWCVGMVAGTALLIARDADMAAGEWIGSNLMYICIAWVFMSITMPLRLKFDSEKARYANIIVVGVILAAAFGTSKLIEYVPDHITESVGKFFAALGDNGIVALSAVIAVAALLISYICSRHIMAKKEF